MTKTKTIRSLKKGTQFIFYGANDVKLIATAQDKRGEYRDCTVEGKEGVFSFRADSKVELVEPVNKKP